jgi:phosphatidylserine/phosphatidylglycerophosphate/cardiolipin synthase-like enzyme
VTQHLAEAAKNGKAVYLLVGLNQITSAEALAAIHGLPNCWIRYFTHRFHAKVYLFDYQALIGSSNLTDGGLQTNREATIVVDDPSALAELRIIFDELWDSAMVLTPEILKRFTQARRLIPRTPELDPRIESAVDRCEPKNSKVGSLKKNTRSIFLEQLRREVYEQYRPAFDEVTRVLRVNGIGQKGQAVADIANEANRFLTWVRTKYASRESWNGTPIRSEQERYSTIIELSNEWMQAGEDWPGYV